MLKKIRNAIALAILRSVLQVITAFIVGGVLGWMQYHWITKPIPLTDEELDLLSKLENED